MYTICNKTVRVPYIRGVNSVKISQFARKHEVEPQAVSRYISRHPEIQAACAQENGRVVDLSPEAVALLEEQYPAPKDPVQVVVGVPQSKFDALSEDHAELQKKYAALLEKVARIQEERVAEQKRLAEAEATQLLLEDKEKRLVEEQERAAAAEQNAAAAREEVVRLRSRGLWARIRNKD